MSILAQIDAGQIGEGISSATAGRDDMTFIACLALLGMGLMFGGLCWLVKLLLDDHEKQRKHDEIRERTLETIGSGCHEFQERLLKEHQKIVDRHGQLLTDHVVATNRVLAKLEHMDRQAS